jgi:hypothetical protein
MCPRCLGIADRKFQAGKLKPPSNRTQARFSSPTGWWPWKPGRKFRSRGEPKTSAPPLWNKPPEAPSPWGESQPWRMSDWTHPNSAATPTAARVSPYRPLSLRIRR